MSVRNLDAIFAPKSIALIGASDRPHAIGTLVARNLLEEGFGGTLLFVNPHSTEVCGRAAYPDVASLPQVPDLAVICTPPDTVPGLVAQLAEGGIKGAVVITAGFGELGSEKGRSLQAQMLSAAKPSLLRIIGPNCLGVLSTPHHINASFAHIPAKEGKIAFVAQSGAMLTTVLDWATARGLGFSHLVSLGDMADVDFGDMLDYLAVDPATEAILLYIEGVTQARKFMSAARAAARLKPVIALKAGRYPAAARAASSHTGALAGLDAVYDAALRRAGIVRVFNLDEVFEAVETLGTRPPVKSDGLFVLTNGGGVGVLAADVVAEQGGRLMDLPSTTRSRLDAVLPPTWSRGNPIDIIGDADGPRYAAALAAVLDTTQDESVLVLNCPTAVASSTDAARAVVEAATNRNRAILTIWLGQTAADEARNTFRAANIPTYDTPEQAVRGFMHLVRYQRGQQLLLQVPSISDVDFSPDQPQGEKLVREGLADGDVWLSPQRVCELLTCYGIPVPRWAMAATEDDAARAAEQIATPVAIKIVSPDVLHKSDVGGVALDVNGATAACAAAVAIRDRVVAARPDAKIQGYFVQEMVRRPNAYELILGMANDTTFGPFLLFGQGGTAVEVINDKAIALPPLNSLLARELLSNTRIFRLLQGYRDHPPAALDAIAHTLIRLSQLVCDIGEIVELDINPLLADAVGVIALDARVKIGRVSGPADGRLAIKPYPKQLEGRESIAGMDNLLLRPLKPEDAPAMRALFEKLRPEDIRLRFFSALRNLPDALRVRLTQLDYDREMAFVLWNGSEALGVVRLAADPDNTKAEFAILVRSDVQGRGIGRLLLTRLLEYARHRGICEIFGDILSDNKVMLHLCHELGFKCQLEGSGVMRASLVLK